MLRRIPPLIMILMLFAIYGFLLQVIADPVNTLIVLGLCVLLFLLVNNYLKTGRFLSGGSRRPPQIKQKAAQQRPPAKKTSHSPRKHYPFQVIEGNKGKSKQNQKADEQDSPNNLSH